MPDQTPPERLRERLRADGYHQCTNRMRWHRPDEPCYGATCVMGKLLTDEAVEEAAFARGREAGWSDLLEQMFDLLGFPEDRRSECDWRDPIEEALEEAEARGRAQGVAEAREAFAARLDAAAREERELADAQDDDGCDGAVLRHRAEGLQQAAGIVRGMRIGADQRARDARREADA